MLMAHETKKVNTHDHYHIIYTVSLGRASLPRWLSISISIYIYIIAETERKWIPTIKEVVTNRKKCPLK